MGNATQVFKDDEEPVRYGRATEDELAHLRAITGIIPKQKPTWSNRLGRVPPPVGASGSENSSATTTKKIENELQNPTNSKTDMFLRGSATLCVRVKSSKANG